MEGSKKPKYHDIHIMANFSLLLFDLGGVLIENHGFEKLNHFLVDPLETDDLKERWLKSSAVRRFELGKISPQDFAIEFVSEWNFTDTPDKFLAEFTSWPRGFYPQALSLVRKLRRRYSVGCFSNSNSLHWNKFGNLAVEFDFAISSHLIGAVKPDREAFAIVLRQCDVQPETVCFFDDSPANVHTANSIGMRGFHVNGFHELRQAIESEVLKSK